MLNPFKKKDKNDDNIDKCKQCLSSICCTYITQKIETPRSKDDFQHLLWQVSHHNVQIYKDTDGWYLLFNTTCAHLENNGNCGIYETRPQICKDYANNYCEFDSPAEEGFSLHFQNHESLLIYCKKRYKRWGK